MKNRQVVCLRKNGNTAYEVIPDFYCDMDERPPALEPCQASPCPPDWFMTDWSEVNHHGNQDLSNFIIGSSVLLILDLKRDIIH